MTDRQENLHAARVEAAARALREDEEFMEEVSSTLEVSWSNRIASTALNAADRLVTVEKIAEALHREATDDGEVHVLWGGAAEHEAEVSEWLPYARAVHALLTGEEA